MLTNEAEKQLLQWKKSGQKKDLMKILSLFNELEEHPSTGTGQIEQLKGNLSGYWSRRINKHSRIIYAIHEDIVTVEVISLKSHYGDK
jgi:toxin YoeB